MDKVITVWHMNGVMDAGGTESLIMNIFRYRTGRINHVLVVHSSNENQIGVYDEDINNLGIRILRLPSVGSVGEKRYTKKFCELVEKEGKPDIIHSHLNAVGGIIAKAAKKADIEKRIIHCHADIKYRGSKVSIAISELKLAVMKILVNKYGTDFFACSENAARRLFYNSDQVIVIKNVISVEKYLCSREKYKEQRHKLGIDDNTILISAVVRIVRIKNYEVIIRAVSELIKLGVDVKFLCYGRVVDEQYFSELQSLCDSCKVKDYIFFMGNSTEIFNDIAACDIFVMPSITEGLGISALEAQAAGKCCLLSTGVPKEADVGINLVKFLDPRNVTEWVQNMESINEVAVEQDAIKRAFIDKRYDASFEVKRIEDEYIKIVRK